MIRSRASRLFGTSSTAHSRSSQSQSLRPPSRTLVLASGLSTDSSPFQGSTNFHWDVEQLASTLSSSEPLFEDYYISSGHDDYTPKIISPKLAAQWYAENSPMQELDEEKEDTSEEELDSEADKGDDFDDNDSVSDAHAELAHAPPSVTARRISFFSAGKPKMIDIIVTPSLSNTSSLHSPASSASTPTTPHSYFSSNEVSASSSISEYSNMVPSRRQSYQQGVSNPLSTQQLPKFQVPPRNKSLSYYSNGFPLDCTAAEESMTKDIGFMQTTTKLSMTTHNGRRSSLHSSRKSFSNLLSRR